MSFVAALAAVGRDEGVTRYRSDLTVMVAFLGIERGGGYICTWIVFNARVGGRR